jgi:hypothetical protein
MVLYREANTFLMSSAETISRHLTKKNLTTTDNRTTSVIKKIDFLLCNSCFWCASYLNVENALITFQCPSCKEKAIEWMPISLNDAYSFDYTPATGVILEFSNRKKSNCFC